MPRDVTVYSGIDAMVHAIESYTSLYQKNSLSDTLAREAVTLLTNNIYEVIDNPNNAEARGDMLLGSLYAGMAFANAPVGACHGLAYPLAAHFHISHGHSNTLMLPPVLKYTAVEASHLYAELAPCMFPEINSGTNEEKTQRWIERIEQMALDFGVNPKLSALGMTEADLQMITDGGMAQDRLNRNNFRKVEWQDAHDMYVSIL